MARRAVNWNGTPIERFMRFVVVDAESCCWNWGGYRTKNGYGAFNGGPSNRTVLAHRWSYEHHRGAIGDGLTIDHLCRNRACVNPLHLEAVSMQINVLRGDGPAARNARKEACPQGHPLSGSNLVPNSHGSGRGHCRRCAYAKAERNRKRRDARRRASVSANEANQ